MFNGYGDRALLQPQRAHAVQTLHYIHDILGNICGILQEMGVNGCLAHFEYFQLPTSYFSFWGLASMYIIFVYQTCIVVEVLN